MQRPFQVIIVGASVAGSTLALQLGRAGIKTALIDKDLFPRTKPCGEGLSSLALKELDALGLLDKVLARPHAHYRGYRVWYGERSAPIPTSILDNSSYPSIGIDRKHLDDVIRTEALKLPSVTGYFGARVREIQPDLNQHIVHIDNLRLRAPLIVIASGGPSPLAERLGFRAKPVHRERFGKSFHFRGNFRGAFDQVHVLLEKSHEIFATRVGEKRLNVSILADQKHIGSAELREIERRIPLLLQERFQFFAEKREETGGAAHLASTRRNPAADGVMLVGDACETLDPIGGMGMTHAVLSSSAAGRVLQEAFTSGWSVDDALQAYRERHRVLIRPIRGFTRAVYFLLKDIPSAAALTMLQAEILHRTLKPTAGSAPPRLFGAIGSL